MSTNSVDTSYKTNTALTGDQKKDIEIIKGDISRFGEKMDTDGSGAVDQSEYFAWKVKHGGTGSVTDTTQQDAFDQANGEGNNPIKYLSSLSLAADTTGHETLFEEIGGIDGLTIEEATDAADGKVGEKEISPEAQAYARKLLWINANNKDIDGNPAPVFGADGKASVALGDVQTILNNRAALGIAKAAAAGQATDAQQAALKYAQNAISGIDVPNTANLKNSGNSVLVALSNTIDKIWNSYNDKSDPDLLKKLADLGWVNDSTKGWIFDPSDPSDPSTPSTT